MANIAGPPTKKVIEFIKLLPYGGRWVAYAIEHWGVRVSGALLVGFILACSLAYFGILPNLVISASYKSASPDPPTVSRTKPTYLSLDLVTQTPDWAHTHVFWLETEADDLKRKKVIDSYMTGIVETSLGAAAPQFRWRLETSPGFLVSGWAFRITAFGSSTLLEPLAVAKDRSGQDSILLTVTPCSKGDKLVAVLRISWRGNLKPQDFLSTLHSVIE